MVISLSLSGRIIKVVVPLCVSGRIIQSKWSYH